MSTKAETRWAEARSAVECAINEFHEAGDAIGMEPCNIADDVADIVFDELGITLREEL